VVYYFPFIREGTTAKKDKTRKKKRVISQAFVSSSEDDSGNEMNIEDKRLGVTEGEPSVSSSVVEEEGEQLESETSTDSDSDESVRSIDNLNVQGDDEHQSFKQVSADERSVKDEDDLDSPKEEDQQDSENKESRLKSHRRRLRSNEESD
jgi:hypothetical protein